MEEALTGKPCFDSVQAKLEDLFMQETPYQVGGLMREAEPLARLVIALVDTRRDKDEVQKLLKTCISSYYTKAIFNFTIDKAKDWQNIAMQEATEYVVGMISLRSKENRIVVERGYAKPPAQPDLFHILPALGKADIAGEITELANLELTLEVSERPA